MAPLKFLLLPFSLALTCQAREIVKVPGWPDLKGFPLSFGVKTDDMVYASGMGGMDMKTLKPVVGGVANETRQALVNVKELLAAAGSSLEEVVVCSVVLADIERDFPSMNKVYATFFPRNPPSRICVQAGRLAGNSSVEIQCTAALEGSDLEVVEVPGWPSMAGKIPLSMVTTANGMVYPSGMQGTNMSTLKIVDGGVAAETRQTFANIGEALKAAGSGLDLVLGCEVSLTDIGDFAAMNEAYKAAFPMGGRLGGFPSRVAVQVGGLAGIGKVEIRCIAAKETLKPEVAKSPAGWPTLPYPFSLATRVKGMVYASGMQGFDLKAMKLAPGGIYNETKQTLANIQELLDAAGTSMDQVVSCDVLLRDMADFAVMNKAYATFWPNDPPARMAIQVGKLEGPGRIEIKCIAADEAASGAPNVLVV